MAVILKEVHKEVIRKIKKRALKIHILGICFTFLLSLFFMYGGMVLKIEKDLARQSYEVVRGHVIETKLLEILGTKGISIAMH
jgi:hypothetical protein